MHFYEPRLGHGLPHDPFNAIVGPRPIGWISSQDSEGRLNLAPYSFFNAFNYTPPIVGFASIGYKDTLRNIEETGEFVWNLATRSLAEVCSSTMTVSRSPTRSGRRSEVQPRRRPTGGGADGLTLSVLVGVTGAWAASGPAITSIAAASAR